MNITEKIKLILLVEDEAIISIVTSTTIRKFGYEVITANSGEKAVEIALSNESIKLILMDIDLGSGIDGTEAARQILSSRNIPIVFHTSHSERDMVEKVRGITRYGYVIKSSGDFVLQSSIEMALELFEAHLNLQNSLDSLKQSQQRYALMNNSSLDIIYSYDCKGRFTNANRKLCTEMYLSAEEIIGKTHSELGFSEELCTEWDALHKQVYETQSTVFSYTSTLMPDGKLHHYEIILNPLHDHDGIIIGIGGTSRDVTDKKSAYDEIKTKNEELEVLNEEYNATLEEMETTNEELAQMNEELINTERVRAESEERYRLLFNHSPHGLVHFDMNGIIKNCNEKFIGIIGSSQEKLIGLDMMSLPDAKLTAAIQGALNGEVSYYNDTYKSVTANKATPVKVTIAPIKNTNSEILGGIVIAEDNSAWIKVEDGINKRKESFRQMFYQHNSIMLLIEPNKGQIIDANQSAENFYGYNQDELKNMCIEDINALSPEDVAIERNRAITEERNYFIFPHRIANGKIKTVEVHSSPVTIEGFENPLLFSIVHDITKLKEAVDTINGSFRTSASVY